MNSQLSGLADHRVLCPFRWACLNLLSHPSIPAGIRDRPRGQNGVNKGEVETCVQVSLYLSPPPFPEVLPFPSLFSRKGELWIITTWELTPLVRSSIWLYSAVLHFAQSNLDLSYFPQSIDSQQKGIRVEIGHNSHAHQAGSFEGCIWFNYPLQILMGVVYPSDWVLGTRKKD